MHDPGSHTNAPDSIPPSPDNIKTNGDHVEEDHDDQQTPRGPVGMADGDECCPNEPTEPPDKKEGE
ncbi:hypothetical protein BDN67DRAFT_1014122 [Paxillus ammoniavirescens]|nr:hypothetical protein BDN67DRAFT_1014122 [Paxillus ammoniavirescens]